MNAGRIEVLGDRLDALTGSTREHSLAFAYGTGRNGKSATINTLHAILGDYAQTAAIETFTVSNNDQHPTSMAALRGARLVVVSETEEGKRWAESRIKQLTGGDPIRARFIEETQTMPAAPKFDAMVDAPVQEMFKVTRFDARKMSPKARSVVAAAAIEFLIVTVAALPARHRALAVKGLRKNLTKRVAAMAVALEEG